MCTLPVDEAMQMRSGGLKALQRMFIAEMSEISRIKGIEHALLTAAENQVRAGDEGRTRRVKIRILFVEG
jgi:hypothetical protein